MKRLLGGFIVLILLSTLFVILPASHRILQSSAGGLARPAAPSSSSSSSKGVAEVERGNSHDVVGDVSSRHETGDLGSGSSHASASAADSPHCSSSRLTALQSRFPQMEPTQVCDPKGEFLNPYRPLQKSSRPCRGLKYTDGKWVRREKPPKPMYPALGEILGCCERGFQAQQKKQQRRDLLFNISSAAAAAGVKAGSSSSGAAAGVAESPLSSSSSSSLREELYYEWVPNECDLIPWSEELFCKALRGRDIMFAGDSLNDHWHASLYYLLGGKKDIYKREGTIAGKHRCHGHAICAKYYKKPLKLHHLTNQFLDEKRLINRNYKWWKPIGEYPVLVLNSGSWMRDPADETRTVSDAKWQDFMVKALGLVRRQRYNGTLIWRTTYSGHPYCWRHTRPLEQPLTPQELNPKVAPYDKYRWEFIPKRNEFTTKLWTRAGAHILDVERLTGLMPLGHLGQNHPKYAARNATDCLHYCSPGPAYDTWSELLMNLLLGNL